MGVVEHGKRTQRNEADDIFPSIGPVSNWYQKTKEDTQFEARCQMSELNLSHS